MASSSCSAATRRFGTAYYYVVIACLFIAYLVARWILSSAFGRTLLGIRENETRMELLGYNVPAYKTAIFSVCAAMARPSDLNFEVTISPWTNETHRACRFHSDASVAVYLGADDWAGVTVVVGQATRKVTTVAAHRLGNLHDDSHDRTPCADYSDGRSRPGWSKSIPRLACPIRRLSRKWRAWNGVSLARRSRPATRAAFVTLSIGWCPEDSSTCFRMFSRWRRVANERPVHALVSR
jgi:hypothetical protein